MDSLKQNLKKLAAVTYKVWLSLFLISAIVSILALRHNNQTMVNLRTQVYAADKAGTGVEPALDKLRAYVYGHMNTNLSSGNNSIKPPIQLKYTYDRLEAQAEAASNNTKLYSDAEAYCQAQIPTGFSGGVRVPCITSYIFTHGGNAPVTIPAALYQFDFVSPTWSPDFAGWSAVLTVLLGLATLASFGRRLIK